MSPFNASAREMSQGGLDKPRRGLFSRNRETAQEKADSQEQRRILNKDIEKTRVLKGPMDARAVAAAFPANVVEVYSPNDNATATRAENGLFYLPGKSGNKAFYLASGEAATAVGFSNDREAPRIITTKEMGSRKNLTINQAATTVLENTDYLEYLTLNTEIAYAIEQDMKGPLIESGLIGIFERNGKLSRVLNKMPQAQRARVEIELKKVETTLRAAMKEEGILKRLFGSIFGRRTKGYQAEVYANNIGGHKRKMAVIESIAAACISLILTGGSSVSLLLGKFKGPFTIQKIDGASKDIAAGGVREGATAYIIEKSRYFDEQSLSWEMGEAKSKEMMDSKQSLRSLSFQREKEIRASTPDKKERTNLNENINMNDPEQRRRWLNYIREFYTSQENVGPIGSKFITMVCSHDSIEDFENSYSLPRDPDVRKAIKTFYQGGQDAYGRKRPAFDASLLLEMINDPNKYIGVTSMVNVELGEQSTEEHLNKYRTYTGRKAGKINKIRETAYADRIMSREPESIAQHFEARPVLVAKYIENIKKLTGANVSADALINAIRGNQATMANLRAINTVHNQSTLENAKSWKGEALFVPIRVKGVNGWGTQMIGIVAECSNLAVGPFFQDEYIMQNNPQIKVPARLALMISLGLTSSPGGGSSGGGSRGVTTPGNGGLGTGTQGAVSNGSTWYGSNTGGIIATNNGGFGF